MSKKLSESIRDYAQRWHQIASQFQLAFTKKENVTIFVSVYDRLICQHRASFVNLVQIGERIEDNLKTGKIKDYQKLFKQSSNGVEELTKKTFPNTKSEKGGKGGPLNFKTSALAPTFLCSSYSHVPAICNTPYTSSLTQSYHVSVAKRHIIIWINIRRAN